MMGSVLKSKETLVWLLLAGLTVLSWFLGNEYELLAAENAKIITAMIFSLAFLKVRLVIMYFMEINHAPWVLRIIFELWVLGFGFGLIGFYLLTT